MSARRHVILVGLPGSGKSTVGQQAATILGAQCVDVDAVLVRQMQMPIARIFAEHGETRYREIERQAVRAALADAPSIVVPGAGWAAQPGQIEVARVSALLIYLRTMALTASKRIEGHGDRPLLVQGDAFGTLREMLQVRDPFYCRADHEVKTDARQLEAIVADVVALARTSAGW